MFGIPDATGPRMAAPGFRTSRLRLLSALVLSLGVSSCAIPTKVAAVSPEVPREATPIVIDAALGKLDEAETKRRMERLLASPEMRAVERELVAGMVDGSVAALGDRDRQERIGALSLRYAAQMVRGLSREIARSVSDTGLGSAASEAMTEQLGPAVQTVLRENIGPGIAEALKDEEVHAALGATARVLGREMILGANEALTKIQEGKGSNDGSLLGRVGELASGGAKVATALAWVLGAIVVVLGVWIVKLLAQTKKYRDESEQREAATRLMDEATRKSKGKAGSGELIAALQVGMATNGNGRADGPPSARRNGGAPAPL